MAFFCIFLLLVDLSGCAAMQARQECELQYYILLDPQCLPFSRFLADGAVAWGIMQGSLIVI